MPETLSRRLFLQRSAVLVAASSVPLVGRTGEAFAETMPDPALAERNRLVVLFLAGGNDALNTLVPMGDAPGTERRGVYETVRSSLQLAADNLLPLDRPGDAGELLGLHPSLSRLHGMYQQGRVAIVPGVGYNPEIMSHFESTDVWQSGRPGLTYDSGWVGRHLDRAGIGVGELRGVAMGTELPLLLKGRDRQGMTLPGLPFRFADGTEPVRKARHTALGSYSNHPATEILQRYYGDQCDATVDLVNSLEVTPSPVEGTNVSRLARGLMDARLLLEGDYGVEVVSVTHPGFDTHAAQASLQAARLSELDAAIGMFFDGDASLGIPAMSSPLADRTMVLVFSEFSRRVQENASAGTDHGDAVPLFMVGPAAGRLVPGLHGQHPTLGTVASPAFVLDRTTDVTTVYQAVLQEWLGNPDPAYPDPYQGLFTPA